MLKAMAGIPVLGAFGFQAARKLSHASANDTRQQIVSELGLDDLLASVKPVTKTDGDLIRIGLVGYGIRGRQLARALGFVEKSEFDELRARQESRGDDELKTQIEHGNFNTAIIGICDVFDLHAERGLACASHDIFTGGDIVRQHGRFEFQMQREVRHGFGRDEAAAASPPLHDDDRAAQAADDPIPAGEVP